MYSKTRMCHQLKLVLLLWFNISRLWIIFVFARNEVIVTAFLSYQKHRACQHKFIFLFLQAGGSRFESGLLYGPTELVLQYFF